MEENAETRPAPLSRECDDAVGPALTSEDILEFQRLMREHCGLVLDEQQAQVRANELVMLYRVLLGPIPEDPQNSADSARSNIRALARIEPGKVS